MGVVFIAGVYGVGKTTICNKLSELMSIAHYSASDLITNKIGETYGRNKAVSNVHNNQTALIEQIKSILDIKKKIILSGHFCIFDKQNRVVELPKDTFLNLSIDKIILLINDFETIIKNLNNRDDKTYLSSNIKELIEVEEKASLEVGQKIHIPVYKLKLEYNENDLIQLKKIIMGEILDESFT